MEEKLKWFTDPKVVKLASMNCSKLLLDIATDIEIKNIEMDEVKSEIRKKVIDFEDRCSKVIKPDIILRVE